jgi:hypothetical protein
MDPRIGTSTEALIQERDVSLMISDAMSRDLEAIHQVSALKEALGKVDSPALKEHVERLTHALRDLDPPSERRGRGTGFSAINRDLATLLDVLDADASPTTQALSAIADRLKDLEALLAKWKATKDTELPSLNAELRKLGKPSIPGRP